jgi:cyanophycin synthetase
MPGRHAIVRLGARVRRSDAPRAIGELADLIRLLHRRGLHRTVEVTIHRTTEPGHWVVAFPWTDEGEGETVARLALRLYDNGGGRAITERAVRRVARSATGRAPEWVRDADRRVPIISISGTNGKSTTTRMIAHIARLAGRHVGVTTTDGVIVDGEMVEPGYYTGPQGAHAILGRSDIGLAILETARGGILLRGLAYESNDASVLTNISGDHLDLQGLHTLPELVEVKSVITRVTKPRGAVVLYADDSLVAGVARWVRAPVWLFSLKPTSARVRRHLASGGRCYLLEDDWMVERTKSRGRRILRADEMPASFGGIARHNVANALAAAGGARALGFSIDEVAAGLRDVRSSSDLLPGRMNLYRLGNRMVIVDYAHNVAGLGVLLDAAEGLIGQRGHRNATLSAIIGTAGDRPDDYLRAMAAEAGRRADEIAIKESLTYLRGRTRAGVIGELKEGLRTAGAALTGIPVYEDEEQAVRGELTTAGRLAAANDGVPRVLIAMTHRLRDEIGDTLASLGAKPVTEASQVAEFRSLMAGADKRRQRSRSAPPPDHPAARSRRPAPRPAA